MNNQEIKVSPRAVITSGYAKDHLLRAKLFMDEMQTGIFNQRQRLEQQKLEQNQQMQEQQKSVQSNQHDLMMQREKIQSGSMVNPK